jgi:peptidoglycan/xylan/chitin deacetylase (PgdA/CDA1 family)
VYDLQDERFITHDPMASDEAAPSVILSFDDGPGRYTDEFLNILKQYGIPAVFFWQTRLLNPGRPWQRTINEGHVIGSHTVKHPDLRKLSYDEQFHEIELSKKQIESMTGKPVRYFRPPFGQYNEDTMLVLEQLQLTPVMWRISSFDWELKHNPEQIVRNVVSHLEPGAIILLHEMDQTLHVLPQLIENILKKGYNFTKLS